MGFFSNVSLACSSHREQANSAAQQLPSRGSRIREQLNYAALGDTSNFSGQKNNNQSCR
jgi:hypothetical protein